jgi:hypothetical protein
MRKQFLSLLACGLVAFGIGGIAVRPVVVAQETSKAAAKGEKSEGAKKAAKAGDRLPPNYTKIGISDEQRKKIYEVQNKYEDQISALEKQIADLKAKQKADVEALLTPEQKKSLEAANEESKKKAADKKKAAETKSEDAKKGDK